MTTALVVAFLVAHGLLHLAIWLPHPEPDPAKPPPFAPDHSGALTALALPQPTVHGISVGLAAATGAAYVVAAVALAVDASWGAPLAAAAALLGLVLKTLYFTPWLLLGLTLDVLVLTSAVAGWPVSG